MAKAVKELTETIDQVLQKLIARFSKKPTVRGKSANKTSSQQEVEISQDPEMIKLEEQLKTAYVEVKTAKDEVSRLKGLVYVSSEGDNVGDDSSAYLKLNALSNQIKFEMQHNEELQRELDLQEKIAGLSEKELSKHIPYEQEKEIKYRQLKDQIRREKDKFKKLHVEVRRNQKDDLQVIEKVVEVSHEKSFLKHQF